MKTITLKKLTLQDWRGQNNSVTFGQNTEIKGRNKSGKSTVFNAFLWLMTGADAEDRVNYKLFNEKEEQTYENAKIASVEAVIEIDGMDYTFKKTAKAGWTRKKGREEYEKKSTDDYKFYVDSIERNATDYKKFIEETIAPIDKLKIMLNINQFLKLDWKDMRKQFESMIGEITDEDMKGDYSAIGDLMIKFNGDIELAKSHLKPQIKTLKENVGTPNMSGKLQIEIDALKSNLPDISNLDSVQTEIDEMKEQIANIDKQILGSSESIKPIIEKRNKELADIDALKKEYQQAKSDYELKPIEEANKIKAEISEIDAFNKSVDRANESARKEFERKKEDFENLSYVVANCEKRHKELTEQNNQVKARQFTADTCAYCGQILPEDKLEEAKKKFYEQKEKDHQYIVSQGKQNREYWDRSKAALEKLQKEISEGIIEQQYKSKAEAEKKLADLRNNFVRYEDTIDGKEKLAKIAAMESNLTEIPSVDNTALLNTKKQLLDDISELSKKLGLKEEYNKQVKVIQSKQEELRDSAIQMAVLEKKMHQCEEYEREKAAIIKCRLEGMFNYITVVMWSKTKDGNVVDDCRVLDAEGVDFKVTNTASKIRCGIDIALAVQKHFGLKLPLFVDDADLVNESNMPNISNQLIKLIVTEGDFSVE